MYFSSVKFSSKIELNGFKVFITWDYPLLIFMSQTSNFPSLLFCKKTLTILFFFK